VFLLLCCQLPSRSARCEYCRGNSTRAN